MKDGLAERIIEDRRSQPVRAHLRIALDHRRHAPRFLPGYEARSEDGIAADVHNAAAAEFRDIADVGRIGVGVAEQSADCAQFADLARLDDLAQPHPLRRGCHHERFADLDAACGRARQ